MVCGPAYSSVARRTISIAPSPSSVAPVRAASSDRSMGAQRLRKMPTRLLVGERLDHLFGDVDLLARVDDRVLDDEIELLGFGDLLDHLVRAILNGGELLVAPEIQVLAEFPLRAREITREVGEVSFAIAALGLGHRNAVLFEECLQISQLLRELLDFGVASGEFALELLLSALGRRGVAEKPLGIDESDLV